MPVYEEAHRLLGVDLSSVPGVSGGVLCVLMSEIGIATHLREKFRSAEAFASWLGLCPDNRISGGRILKAVTRKVSNRIANILRLAANALGRADGPMGTMSAVSRDDSAKPRASWGAPTNSPGSSRRLLKNWGLPRESNSGRMARRERRAYPLRSVRSEQHRQTPQGALALRGRAIFSCAALLVSHRPSGYAPLLTPCTTKNRKQRDMSQFFNSLLGHDRFRPALR